MKVVIQRVSEASVRVDESIVGEIDKGFLVLVGIENEDNDEDIEWLSKKIVQLRLFPDEEGQMNRSILDVQGEILLISQFTLHAKTKKGNRPSYIKAARPEVAIPLYDSFKKNLESLLEKKIECGVFGADMKVSLINDGPVTIIIDSKNRE